MRFRYTIILEPSGANGLVPFAPDPRFYRQGAEAMASPTLGMEQVQRFLSLRFASFPIRFRLETNLDANHVYLAIQIGILPHVWYLQNPKTQAAPARKSIVCNLYRHQEDPRRPGVWSLSNSIASGAPEALVLLLLQETNFIPTSE
jgi:hypothetical protein